MLTQGRRSANPVLIISYEAFRSYSEILHKGAVGLIICDEVCRQSLFCLFEIKVSFRDID